MGVTKSYIIVEDRLEEMFAYLPEIKTGFKNYFGYGDKKELNAFLKTKTKGSTTPYPLIWLLYPYNEKHSKTNVEVKNLQLVIAVETGVALQNPQRIIETYKEVLIPLLNNINKVFRTANIVSWNNEYEAIKHPNYSSSDDGKDHAGTFVWDAIKLEYSIVISDDCLRPIKFF